MKTTCHVCGSHELTDTVKCKMCCDGEEQEFCLTCASLYRTYKVMIDGALAFEKLTARRAAWIASIQPKEIA